VIEQGIFGETAESLKATFRDLVGVPLDVSCAFGDNLLPEGLIDLARRLGFELTTTDQFPSTVSAYMEITEETRLIIINRNKHPHHQVLSLAHELSHALLHARRSGLRIDPWEEFQADFLSCQLISKGLNSQQYGEMVRYNPQAASTLVTALLVGVTTLAAMGLAKLESWIHERSFLADESIVQKQPLPGQHLPEKPAYIASLPAHGVTTGQRIPSNQKLELNPPLAGCHAGIPLPYALSRLPSLPGFPHLRRKRRTRSVSSAGTLSQAISIKDVS